MWEMNVKFYVTLSNQYSRLGRKRSDSHWQTGTCHPFHTMGTYLLQISTSSSALASDSSVTLEIVAVLLLTAVAATWQELRFVSDCHIAFTVSIIRSLNWCFDIVIRFSFMFENQSSSKGLVSASWPRHLALAETVTSLHLHDTTSNRRHARVRRLDWLDRTQSPRV